VSVRAAWFTRLPAVLRRATETDEDADPDLVQPPRVMASRVGSWVAALVCLAMVTAVALSFDQYTTRTQRFVVSEFEVNGNLRIDRQAVVAATGVEPGAPLLAVSPAQVRARVETLAWIKRADVQQILPSRLVVQVQEYVPVAMVAAGEILLVDEDGVLFDEVSAGQRHDLPLLTGLPVDALRLGAKEDLVAARLQRDRLRGALALLRQVRRSPVAERFVLGEVHWDPVQGITLISQRDGAEVRLGHMTREALPRQLDQLSRLLADVDRRGERLRYALMDDERRPERATVHVVDAGAELALPGLIRRPRAGGAARPAPPQGNGNKTNHPPTDPSTDPEA